MNKERRTQIKGIVARLNDIKLSLGSVSSDEEFAFDNMPENLQGSLRGEESEYAVEQMNEAAELIDQAIECLSEVI